MLIRPESQQPPTPVPEIYQGWRHPDGSITRVRVHGVTTAVDGDPTPANGMARVMPREQPRVYDHVREGDELPEPRASSVDRSVDPAIADVVGAVVNRHEHSESQFILNALARPGTLPVIDERREGHDDDAVAGLADYGGPVHDRGARFAFATVWLAARTLNSGMQHGAVSLGGFLGLSDPPAPARVEIPSGVNIISRS